MVATDEGIRRGSSLEKMAQLAPVFTDNGVIHAGNSSQISDASAALLLMSAQKAKELRCTPIARVHTAVVAATDPVIMLTAPIPAPQKALKRSGLAIGEIGVFEVSEVFAPVTLAWLADLGADANNLNPLGGLLRSVTRWAPRARAS